MVWTLSVQLWQLFQHTAARRRLENKICATVDGDVFQHTAARRRLGGGLDKGTSFVQFQHTAARRRLDGRDKAPYVDSVSFNTQPPEGGWFFMNTSTLVG